MSAEAEDGRASFWSLKLCCGLVSTWLSVFPFSKKRKVSVTVTEGLGEETRTADPAFVAHPGAEEGQGVPSPADCAGAQAAGGWRRPLASPVRGRARQEPQRAGGVGTVSGAETLREAPQPETLTGSSPPPSGSSGGAERVGPWGQRWPRGGLGGDWGGR